MNFWEDSEVFSALDRHLARRMGALSGETNPWILLAVALACRAVSQGHVCFSLWQPDPIWRKEAWQLPAPEDWLNQLQQSPLFGAPEQEHTPLVLGSGGRLYLRRYWAYERQLVRSIQSRAQRLDAIDPARLKSQLDRLFGKEPKVADLQREAAFLAAQQRLLILSGGPGTGKTTTVTRILALLQENAMEAGAPLRILLAAPTGKAAARLVESIQRTKLSVDASPGVLQNIPEQAYTLHRALGHKPGSRTQFLHDADNPLPYDLVVVDECSMVDIALMAKLSQAIPDHARWLLIGDRDQLASVEAGSVFGDLCNSGGARVGRSTSFLARNPRSQRSAKPAPPSPPTPGIWDCTLHLEHSHRFDPEQGIGRLAKTVHAGDPAATLMLLAQHTKGNGALRWIRADDLAHARTELREALLRGFAPLFRADTPEQALVALAEFRLLAAHRKGTFGIEELNALARSCFVDRDQGWFRGQPVLITENSPENGLYNGDTGVCWPSDTGWRVIFPDGRSVSTSRLPPHEPAFAMTVHKSQGSEFDRVLLVLPAKISPVTTRELVYTAITRAKRQVTLLGDPEVISVAVQTRIQRASGLREALWSAW